MQGAAGGMKSSTFVLHSFRHSQALLSYFLSLPNAFLATIFVPIIEGVHGRMSGAVPNGALPGPCVQLQQQRRLLISQQFAACQKYAAAEAGWQCSANMRLRESYREILRPRNRRIGEFVQPCKRIVASAMTW